MITGTIKSNIETFPVKYNQSPNLFGFQIGDKVIKTNEKRIFEEITGTIIQIHKDYQEGFNKTRNRYEPFIVKWYNSTIDSYAAVDIEKLPVIKEEPLDIEDYWYNYEGA